MQSNKASKKTRKNADETVTATPVNAAAEPTPTQPRNTRSSKTKKNEPTEMGLSNHQHKSSPVSIEELATEVVREDALPAKHMVATAAAAAPAPVEIPTTPASWKPDHEEIAKLAHSYWAKRGYQHGSPEEDWLRAERELATVR